MTQQSFSRSVTRGPWKTLRTLALAGTLLAVGALGAERSIPSPSPSNSPADSDSQKGAILLTIFLRRDQSKTLDEINAALRKQGYYKAFPPPGVEVVSWYVVMGIGQVVTLRVPPDRLRMSISRSRRPPGGGYRTEFYPTYDYRPIGEAEHAKAQ